MGSSLASLTSAVDLLSGQRVRGHRGLGAFSLALTNALLWICRQPLRGLLTLQAHLLFRNSQRAEYLADELAATLAGTDAVIALHDAMLAAPAVQTAIRRVTLSDDHTESAVLKHIRSAASASGATQQAERREKARKTRQRLTSTHPTTFSRIAVLQQRPHRPAVITLDTAVTTALTDELHAQMSQHTPALIDRDLEHLSYGR